MEGHREEDRKLPEPRHSDPVLPSDRAYFRPHREGLQRSPASPLVGGGVLLAGANHAPADGIDRSEAVLMPLQPSGTKKEGSPIRTALPWDSGHLRLANLERH